MPAPSPSSSGKALTGKIFRTCLLPVGLGLLCSWGWVRWHPGTEEDAAASTAPAGDATSSRDSDRLPPDATSERVLMAAIGGNTAAAKEYLLRELPRLQTGKWDINMSRIVAAVVEDDPGWYETYLGRWLDALPSYATENEPRDQIGRHFSQYVLGAIWKDNHAAMWKAAEVSPALRKGLGDLRSFGFGIAPSLRSGSIIDSMSSSGGRVHPRPAPEDALQILNPLFKIDDAQIGYLCGPVADLEVQRRLLALAEEGHFEGRIPVDALKSLADLKVRQPQDFQILEAGMTESMKQQIEGWRDPSAITSNSPHLTAEDFQNLPVDGAVVYKWAATGLSLPIEGLLQNGPASSIQQAALASAEPAYFAQHIDELDEQMRRLSSNPGDEEALQGFANDFIKRSEDNGNDPARLIGWRQYLDDSGKEELFQYYASRDPGGALQYATEKMSGPDRDHLIEAATKELP